MINKDKSIRIVIISEELNTQFFVLHQSVVSVSHISTDDVSVLPNFTHILSNMNYREFFARACIAPQFYICPLDSGYLFAWTVLSFKLPACE